jgi:molybdate transport system ATP-binding protein
MSEIERLADHLVLMQHGHVVGAGPLAALQSDPSLPLATAREAARSAWTQRLNPTTRLWITDAGRCRRAAAGAGAAGRSRQAAAAVIAASDVSIACAAPDATSILNVLPARIVSKSLLGQGEVIVVLALGTDGSGARLLARITRRSWDMLGLAEAMTVYAQVKGASLVSGPDIIDSQNAGSAIVPEPSPESTLIPDFGAPISDRTAWSFLIYLPREAP